MILEFKDYEARVELKENGFYYGRITNIPDLVIFQTKDESKLMDKFKASIEDYEEFCEEEGAEIRIGHSPVTFISQLLKHSNN